MNLLLISTNYPTNCSSHKGIFVKEQVKALRNSIDGQITVISPVPWSPRALWFKKKWKEYGKIEKERCEDGIKVYHPRYLLMPGIWFFPLEGFFIYLSIRSLIRKLIKSSNGKMILHSHTILPDGLTGTLVKREYGIAHVCTVHGSDINIYPSINKLINALTKYALKAADKIVAVSHKIKERSLLLCPSIKNITVIYNGADSGQFRQLQKAKERLDIDENRKIVMFIGNLVPVKGVEFLITAFAELLNNRDRDDVVLFVIGDGSEKNRLVQLARNLQIENKVFFFGKKTHSEIPLWLNIADIFVLPSLSEGFPTVLVEALMCGIPVIASDVGGISEIITPEKTGLLTEPGNTDQIREAIATLLHDNLMKENLIACGIERSRDYTWENNARLHMRLYNDLS